MHKKILCKSKETQQFHTSGEKMTCTHRKK